MIDKVVAVGFKGLEFSFDLKRLNLVIGPMGCGKTSISDTIELTTNGRIPGAGKTNQAIMDAFASEDKMFLGVSSNDQFFERRFIRSKSGKVTQKFRAGNSFVSKEDFITAFAVADRPVIFNIHLFMGLSDEKKINAVFKLYPPKGDVFSLHEKIEQTTGDINTLNAEITKTEGIIQKLTVDQAKVELPHGTLAEVQQEIERTVAEITLCRKNLNRQIKIEADEAAAKRAEEAKEKAKEKEEHRPQLGGDPGYTARNSEDFHKEEPIFVPPHRMRSDGDFEYTKTTMPTLTDKIAAAAIQEIIDTMDEAGCSVCAAKLVAKQALIKLN